MALPYASVRDLYDTLRRGGATQLSLPEWSAQMNQQSGTENYAAGISDNFIKQASYGIDQLLNATGLPEVTAGFGRNVGEWVGDPESGEAIGRSLPRQVVNFAPMALAALPIPGAAPLGYGLSAGLAGAESYTATDSPLSGLLTGAVTAAMPGIATVAEQGALRLLQGEAGRLVGSRLINTVKGPVYEGVNKFLPRDIGQGIISQLAGQGAAAVAGEGQRATEALFSDDIDYDFSPTRALLEMTLGQIPFAATYATKNGRIPWGGKATQEHRTAVEEAIALTQLHVDTRKLNEEREQTPPVAKPPPEVDPLTRAKTEKILSEVRNPRSGFAEG